MSAVAGDGLAAVSLATDATADGRVLVWRLDGGVLVIHGRAALGEAGLLSAPPRAPFHVLARLCSASAQLRRGAGGTSTTAALTAAAGDGSMPGGDALFGSGRLGTMAAARARGGGLGLSDSDVL